MEYTILLAEYFDTRDNKEFYYTLSKVDKSELLGSPIYVSHLYNKTDNSFSKDGFYHDNWKEVLTYFQNKVRIARERKDRMQANNQLNLSKKYDVLQTINNKKFKVAIIKSKLDKKENLFLPNTWKVYGGKIRYFSKVGKETPQLALKNLKNARKGNYELQEIAS